MSLTPIANAPPSLNAAIRSADRPSVSARIGSVSDPSTGAAVSAVPPPSASLNGVPSRSCIEPSALRAWTRMPFASTCSWVIT